MNRENLVDKFGKPVDKHNQPVTYWTVEECNAQIRFGWIINFFALLAVVALLILFPKFWFINCSWSTVTYLVTDPIGIKYRMKRGKPTRKVTGTFTYREFKVFRVLKLLFAFLVLGFSLGWIMPFLANPFHTAPFIAAAYLEFLVAFVFMVLSRLYLKERAVTFPIETLAQQPVPEVQPSTATETPTKSRHWWTQSALREDAEQKQSVGR